MKLITWNINSVRLRLPLLLHVLKTERPDVVCLQETKCPDEAFPMDTVNRAGYIAHINGMKSYNGVAILSRTAIDAPKIHPRAGRHDCRHISGVIDGITIHNIYIPAGGDIPDRNINEKFGHKLDFIDDVGTWFARTHKKDARAVVMGDFNVAPMEHDVWSHRALLDVVSHTPIEVEKLTRFQNQLGWVDTSRAFVPPDEKCYTWWSYRNQDWKKSNRGRRLDHVWVTPALQPALRKHKIMVQARDFDKPSDHVPVVVELRD